MPSLYQINTRVWLTSLSGTPGRPATLDDIPDAELDRLAAMGFDWIWFLSVWQTGLAGQKFARHTEWRKEFEETLPDLREEDIVGSGFAITGYSVHRDLGGDDALARLRERLRKRGLRLMLDFVPNHTGLDHPWVEAHSDFYIPGSELDLARAPQNYTRVKRPSSLRSTATTDGRGDLLLAHGRDPYFAGWADTLQLNYGNPATQEAMIGELLKIAGHCDGVRCDMAMLVLPEVFERTWGIAAQPFWPKATQRVRERVPDFCFMAEVYWDLEWTLQQQGFDYAYDKRLYDRLRDGHARPIREHFHAPLDYQAKLARFIENHDEARAAAAFAPDQHAAAATLTFLSPGLRFFHQGQFEGRLKRISPHLGRGPNESVNLQVWHFYERLLDVLRRPAIRHGQWQLLESVPAFDGNESNDNFIAFVWSTHEPPLPIPLLHPASPKRFAAASRMEERVPEGRERRRSEFMVREEVQKEQVATLGQKPGGDRMVVAVNYSANRSQCYLRLPFPDLGCGPWRLQDLLGDARYDRDGADLQSRGFYLDVAPWQCHAFELTTPW